MNRSIAVLGVRGKLETAGLIVPPADQRSPDALKRRMSDEIARWSDKSAKIQPAQ